MSSNSVIKLQRTCSRVLCDTLEHTRCNNTENQPDHMFDTQICPANKITTHLKNYCEPQALGWTVFHSCRMQNQHAVQ